MYDSQIIANRIKARAKTCGFTVKTMLNSLDLGENAVSQLAKGHGMSYLNLAKIADYLDCSVDYLLCRTDNPAGSANTYVEDNNGIVQAHNASAVVNTATTNERSADIMNQFLNAFDKLEIEDKLAVMNLTMEKMKKGA